MFGPDIYLQHILQFLCDNLCLQAGRPGQETWPSLPCRACVALTRLLCQRSKRALVFAYRHANCHYPVSLCTVAKVARSCKYTFSRHSGARFSLLSKDVTFRFRQQFAELQQPTVVRECQVQPRIGKTIAFAVAERAASCGAQWSQTTRMRRSGGLLCAVRPCLKLSLPLPRCCTPMSLPQGCTSSWLKCLTLSQKPGVSASRS